MPAFLGSPAWAGGHSSPSHLLRCSAVPTLQHRPMLPFEGQGGLPGDGLGRGHHGDELGAAGHLLLDLHTGGDMHPHLGQCYLGERQGGGQAGWSLLLMLRLAP